jgi:hypothetical protein
MQQFIIKQNERQELLVELMDAPRIASLNYFQIQNDMHNDDKRLFYL